METFGIEDWQRWRQAGCTRLPAVLVCRDESPPPTWENITDAPVTALLESAQGGRYTYLCDRPARVILGRADGAEIRSADGAMLLGHRHGKPLEVLRALLAESKTPALPGWPAMTGGLIGVLGYDLVHTWERLAFSAPRDLPLPLYAMLETRELFVFDHVARTLGIVVWCDVAADAANLDATFRAAAESATAAHRRWRQNRRAVNLTALSALAAPTASAPSSSPPTPPPPPSFTPTAFQDAVRRIHDYIAAGDTYQVNLSLRTSRATPLPAAALYESLRRVNPSPYMGLLRLPDFALVCGSPELLVRLVDGVVSSRPIAGTRPRGAAAREDADFFGGTPR